MKEYIVSINANGWIKAVKNELVRCKDCKYNDDNECIIKAGWFPVKDDWYCADGVKRDG